MMSTCMQGEASSSARFVIRVSTCQGPALRRHSEGTQKDEVDLPCSFVVWESFALLDFLYLFVAGWHWGAFVIRLLR